MEGKKVKKNLKMEGKKKKDGGVRAQGKPKGTNILSRGAKGAPVKMPQGGRGKKGQGGKKKGQRTHAGRGYRIDGVEVPVQDIRNRSTTMSASSNQELVTVNDQVVIGQDLLNDACSGLAYGFVSAALNKGWQNFASSPASPYYAWVRLSQGFANAALSNTSYFQNVPLSVALVIQALTPKQIPYYGGKIAYKFINPTTSSVPGATGTATVNSYYCLNVLGSAMVNSIWPVVVAPAGYSDSLGVDALADMFQFMSDKGDSELCKLVSAAALNEMSNNSSAYQPATGAPGTGWGGFGGPHVIISGEIKPRSPIFSCIVKSPSANQVYPGRGIAGSKEFGTDPVFCGAALSTVLRRKQLNVKSPPVIKSLNFYEFVHTLAKTLAYASQTALQDVQIVGSIDAGASVVQDYIFQITFQDFQLLLANVLRAAYASTQCLVQTMINNAAGDPNTTFIPFMMNQNTVPAMDAINMQMPLAIKEMINSNTGRINYGSRGGDANPTFVFPVLGKFENSFLDAADYTVGFKGVTYPLFQVPPTTATNTTKVSAEDPINVIDGRSGSAFVALNDNFALKYLLTLYNGRFDKLKPFMDTSAQYSCDGGPAVLNQTGVTKHIVIGDNERRRHFKETKVASNLATYQIAGTTFGFDVIKSAYQLTENWVSPCNMIVGAGNSNASVTNFQKMSVVFKEPRQLANTTAGVPTTNVLMNGDLLALTLVHDRNGEDSELTKWLISQGDKGQAGILSDIGGAMAAAGIQAGATQLGNVIRLIPF